MKAHIRADRVSKLMHTVCVTAVNVADVTKTADLLQDRRHACMPTRLHRVEKRADIVALGRTIYWQTASKRGLIKALADGAETEPLKAIEKAKASVRALAPPATS